MALARKFEPFALFVSTLLTVLCVTSPALAQVEINVMGPLLVGDQSTPGKATDQDWAEFRKQLTVLKQSGVQAISTDVWWGLVEGAGPGRYEWNYYKAMAEAIRASGLKWVPILSFHKLGGNVGDQGVQEIPAWVWSRHTNYPERFQSSDDLKFKSQFGRLSDESISVWATDVILADYKRFMESFAQTFASYAPIISEINISLGPAGELRYPSYNQHDNTDTVVGENGHTFQVEVNRGGYNTRGSIQAYSKPAIRSFQDFVKRKYGNIESVNRSWGFSLNSMDQIQPPNPQLLQNAFWEQHEPFSPYGKDFFDWYNASLALHGRKVLTLASLVFGKPNSSMKHTTLGAKIPGVHWRLGSDRAAELSAGLIRTSYPDWNSPQSGFGYNGILAAFKPKIGSMKFTLHFTALEMDDYRDGKAENKPKTLVHWMAKAAQDRGLTIKGENALAGSLSDPRGWDNIFEAIKDFGYKGVTILRSNEVVPYADRIQHLRYLHDRTQTPARVIGGTCEALF